VQARVVVYGDLPCADDLESITSHGNRSRFRKADTQQIRELFDQGNQVVPAVTRVDVLIDRRLSKKREAGTVLRFRRDRNVVVLDCAANQELTLYGGSS